MTVSAPSWPFAPCCGAVPFSMACPTRQRGRRPTRAQLFRIDLAQPFARRSLRLHPVDIAIFATAVATMAAVGAVASLIFYARPL
jgi:hypothetical protein